MKFLDLQNKTNQTMKDKEEKEKEKGEKEKKEIADSIDNEMIKVNLIPKGRMKRSPEEINNDILEDPTQSVSKKRNILRKRRAPLLMNDLKLLEKEIIKENTTARAEEETVQIKLQKEEKPEIIKSIEAKPEEKTDNEHHTAKYKLLQRKLLHQEKLESQIEHYLQKIRQSKADLKNELEKSFNFKQFGGHVKKHVKREVLNLDSDEIRDIETNKITGKSALETDEDTLETNIIFNEISKEGRNVPSFVKENDEATYKLKVKPYPKKRINNIIKMFENESKQIEIEKPKKNVITTSSTTTPAPTLKENKKEVFYDAHDEHINTTSKTVESNEDGFVDEAFKTLSQCLSDFHKKIVEFLRFLSP